MRFRRGYVLNGIFLTWLVGVLCYGWIEVSRVMAQLRVAPSPDLYANDLGFQVVAFILTKGFASLLVLGVALLAGACIPLPNLPLQPTQASCAGRSVEVKR